MRLPGMPSALPQTPARCGLRFSPLAVRWIGGEIVSKPGEPVSFPATVLIDTREQLPLDFQGMLADARDGGGPLVVETRRATLGQGDYSIEGYEGRISVERKSAADLFSTLGQGRDRFERELERLATLEFAAVVVEAQWSEVLTDPPRYSELNPKTVFRSVIAWQQRHPRVHWWFVDGRRFAEITTLRILERFWKDQQTRNHAEGKQSKRDEMLKGM